MDLVIEVVCDLLRLIETQPAGSFQGNEMTKYQANRCSQCLTIPGSEERELEFHITITIYGTRFTTRPVPTSGFKARIPLQCVGANQTARCHTLLNSKETNEPCAMTREKTTPSTK